jgi:hypothetical protein
VSYRGHREWHRCNDCGTRRSTVKLLFAHLLKSPQCAPCKCGGYHYAHRRGSPQCEHNLDAPIHLARAHGATPAEVAEVVEDLAFARALGLAPSRKPQPGGCPF